MKKRDKWLYQNFAGLIDTPDEYQRHEIDKTLAKFQLLLYIRYLHLFIYLFSLI